MKLMKFVLFCLAISVALSLASCSSVAISMVSSPGLEAPSSALTSVQATSVETASRSEEHWDTETGALVLGAVPIVWDQGRKPGTFEAPPAKTSISHAPQAWDLTLLAGYRNMSSGAWNELQNQGVIGLEAAFYTSPTSQVGVEAGIQGSYSRDGERTPAGQHFNLDGNVGEIYAGGRSRGRIGTTPIRWGVGLGLGLLRADREDIVNGAVERGNDVSITFYWHLLAAIDITLSMYFGLDVRADFGSTMTINGNPGSASYWQLALALGFDL